MRISTKSDQRNIRNQNNENHQDEKRLKKDKTNPYAKDDSEKQQGTVKANTFEGQQTDGEAANRHGDPENNRDNRANDTNNQIEIGINIITWNIFNCSMFLNEGFKLFKFKPFLYCRIIYLKNIAMRKKILISSLCLLGITLSYGQE